MTHDPIDIVRGGGNAFADFGLAEANVRQAKALMGTQIMRILDADGLSTRQAEARTGISHSDFSRIRRAKFSRFTIDRLVAILSRFGQEVELSVSVRPRPADADAAASVMLSAEDMAEPDEIGAEEPHCRHP